MERCGRLDQQFTGFRQKKCYDNISGLKFPITSRGPGILLGLMNKHKKFIPLLLGLIGVTLICGLVKWGVPGDDRFSRSVGVLLLMWLALMLLVLWLWWYMQRQQQSIQRQFYQVTNTDCVTGIANKQRLLTDLESTQHPNLGFIKIVNYQALVSRHGPTITDEIIKKVAEFLNNFNDPRLDKVTAYRIESDVFALLEDQDISHQEVGDVITQIVKQVMGHQYPVGDDLTAQLQVIVGGVNYKQDAYVLANMAVQEAELKGLPYYFIDKAIGNLPHYYLADAKAIHELKQALDNGDIRPHYQPIFCARSRQVVKYECLARWVDDQGQVVKWPDDFLALAHRSHVYHKVTRCMLNQAIEFSQKQEASVAVNISVADVRNKKTRKFIYETVKASGIADRIHFELLENEHINEEQIVIDFIEQLQGLGAKVGLDDLGKGYSNIERFINLPINFVKIDRSIMENLLENKNMQKMAQSIIALAHQKGLNVTAEFCANEEITDMAIKLGADFLQGFHLGEPEALPVTADSQPEALPVTAVSD